MADQSDFPLMPYTFAAKQLESVKTKPGCWDVSRVGIFKVPIVNWENDEKLDWDNGQLVGEYTYGFSFRPGLFRAFRYNRQWYALYSTDYTASRVMRIFEKDGQWAWEDVCGQEGSTYGFCPVSFYVPHLYDIYSKDVPCDSASQLVVDEDLPGEGFGYGDWSVRAYRSDFAFVAGTIWGDDGSGMKLQIVDLRDLDKGIYRQEARFGYLPLPEVELSKLIDARYSAYICGYNRRVIKISGLDFDFDTGELMAEGLKVTMKNTKPKDGSP